MRSNLFRLAMSDSQRYEKSPARPSQCQIEIERHREQSKAGDGQSSLRKSQFLFQVLTP